MNQGNNKKRIVANSLVRLSVKDLREEGFFKGIVSGDIPMVQDFSMIAYFDSLFAEGSSKPNGPVGPYIVDKGTYHILVSTTNKNAPYMHLSYNSLQPNGENKKFGYYVGLETTPCRYGNVRYWFQCLYCGRRVAKLFKYGDYFACRHCHYLTYRSRQLSGKYEKLGVIDMSLVYVARDPRKWRQYRGKPTRKNRRAQQMNERFNQALDMFNAMANIRVNKFAEKADRFLEKEKRRRAKLLSACNAQKGKDNAKTV